AHAVGDDVEVMVLEDQQAVLVAPATAPLVGLRRGADEDERVDARRLVDGGVFVVDDGDGGGRLAQVVLFVGRRLGAVDLGRRAGRGGRRRTGDGRAGLRRQRVHGGDDVRRRGQRDDGDVLVGVLGVERGDFLDLLVLGPGGGGLGLGGGLLLGGGRL